MGPKAIRPSWNGYSHAGRLGLEFTQMCLSRARPHRVHNLRRTGWCLPIRKTQDAYLDAILGFLVQAHLMALWIKGSGPAECPNSRKRGPSAPSFWALAFHHPNEGKGKVTTLSSPESPGVCFPKSASQASVNAWSLEERETPQPSPSSPSRLSPGSEPTGIPGGPVPVRCGSTPVPEPSALQVMIQAAVSILAAPGSYRLQIPTT